MPIYAYKCESCGHAKDFLQKMSDPPLTDCPACGKPALAKQVTAAGFQLKGSGWYVTDFRGGNSGAPKPEAKTEGAPGTSAPAAATPAPAASTDSKPAAAPAAPAPAPSSGSAA